MLTKFLFIDDNSGWLHSIVCALSKNGFVLAEKCCSVGEAIAAMRKHRPDVLFLDHHLTDHGEEGYEIADIALANNIKVYSTTSDSEAVKEYTKRGISCVGKGSPLSDFRKIIAEHLAI